jgi:hypothetical protein
MTTPDAPTPTPQPQAEQATTPNTAPAPKKISAREGAEQMLAWAEEHHMLDEMTIGAQSAAAVAPQDGSLFPHAQRAISTLRTKQIAGVLFNEEERTVYVLTRRKLGQHQIKTLPLRHQDIDIKYLHYGHAQSGQTQPPDGPAYHELNGRYCCGSSIHPAKHPGAGTLGCLLRDASGNLYGLSANHVSGLASYADHGEKILAPGHSDITAQGRDPFTIGVHVRALTMVPGSPTNVDIAANSDAAVFAIRQPDSVSSHQAGHYDTPAIVADPKGGMLIEKIGRTTGHTTGRILGMSPTPQGVSYQMSAVGGNATVYFNSLVTARGENGGLFSTFGDSGSLVVGQTDTGYAAIGLVVAGTNTGYSLILPIRPILEALDMTLVANHYT